MNAAELVTALAGVVALLQAFIEHAHRRSLADHKAETNRRLAELQERIAVLESKKPSTS